MDRILNRAKINHSVFVAEVNNCNCVRADVGQGLLLKSIGCNEPKVMGD